MPGLQTTQMLVFRFGPETSFEGALLGAVERMETGMDLRILEFMFLRRDPETGELDFLRSDGSSGLASAVLEFRLEPASRRKTSETALAQNAAVAEFGQILEQGEAIVALLVQHRWVETLADAVTRMGGDTAAIEFVEANSLNDALPRLRASLDREGNPGSSPSTS